MLSPEHGRPAPAVETGALDALVERMLGGSLTSFCSEYWGKKTLFVPGAGKDYAGIYSVDDFIADVVATQPAPYLSVGARNGKRYFAKHATGEELMSGILAGGVGSMKMSKIWHSPTAPERWSWTRALFGSLCRALSMIYMSPARSEDVDLFLAGPESGLGAHFDSTEVFTLQLFGERKWTVEEELKLDEVLNLARDPDWRPANEVEFPGATKEVTLRAGDALYVPAYCLHRVTGVTWSVSLSLGLRAFNEIDFVEHLLEITRLTKYVDYKPVHSVPEALGEAHVEAKLELLRRVRALLERIEMTAMFSLVEPLSLPPTLANVESASPVPNSRRILGGFTSGFALFEEPKEQRILDRTSAS